MRVHTWSFTQFQIFIATRISSLTTYSIHPRISARSVTPYLSPNYHFPEMLYQRSSTFSWPLSTALCAVQSLVMLCDNDRKRNLVSWNKNLYCGEYSRWPIVNDLMWGVSCCPFLWGAWTSPVYNNCDTCIISLHRSVSTNLKLPKK